MKPVAYFLRLLYSDNWCITNAPNMGVQERGMMIERPADYRRAALLLRCYVQIIDGLHFGAAASPSR